MNGYAVSGFVDGLFQGIGARQGWEDRKREQARQDKLDKMNEGEYGRRITLLDQNIADGERQRADDEAMRTVYKDAFTETSQSMGAIPPNTAPPSPVVAPPAPMDPATQTALRTMEGTGAIPPKTAQAVIDKAALPAQPLPNVPIVAGATPADKAASATAVQTLDQGASIGAKDATVAATNAMGVKPGQAKITDAQYERGSTAFLDRYMEVGAPKVFEALVQRGEFDKAQKFMEFMQSAETKAGMQDWAKAAAAVTLGDMDTFGKHIIKAYNRMGYFPDGITVVESESGMTRGQDGEVNGARLVFKDEATGNTWEQVYSGADDLIRTGMTLLAPENAFDAYIKQSQAASESAMGAAKKQEDNMVKDQEQIIQSATKIMEASKGINGNVTITFDEAMIAAQTALDKLKQRLASPAPAPVDPSAGGQSAPPPVLFRPPS